MDKKTVITAVVAAVITLVFASKIRSTVPLANKIPSV